MVTVKEVVSYIENIAHISYQETYDNSGLLVGNEAAQVKGVLLCLDSTEDVVDEAIKKNCNLIISHHPIIFQGLKKLNGKTYVERVIIKAIQNNIAIYTAHTNLDNTINGVNSRICEKLHLKNCKILAPKKNALKKLVTFCPPKEVEKLREALFSAGGGTIGNYDKCSFNISGIGTFRGLEGTKPFVGNIGSLHQEEEIRIEIIFPAYLEENLVNSLIKAHPYEEVAYDVYFLDNYYPSIGSGMIGELEEEVAEKSFLENLKKLMNTSCIRYTSLLSKNIKKVAVCGGSGSFLIKQAIAEKAQIFISSDIKYHQFFDAENKIIVADIGHYESEQFTKELFYDILNKKFSTFAIHVSEINTNPINYL